MGIVKRVLLVAYATVAYLWFLADVLWAIAFLADVPVPTAIDHGHRGSTATAVVVDLALLGVFAIHHSVMAREGAKRFLARVLPASAERSTYVLAADALLALVFWQWRPIGGAIWQVPGQPWRAAVWVGYALGWVLAVSATFMIDHFDFVGLRQAATRPGDYRPPTFRERWLYAWVRHPLMLGLLIAFWVTPGMSGGHLLFATASTGYIAVGVYLEERGLRRQLGEAYRDYARRTPAIVPGLRRAAAGRRKDSTFSPHTAGPL
jgi:protein-S-isoprenylcysteine O-methyltransferase Ste14